MSEDTGSSKSRRKITAVLFTLIVVLALGALLLTSYIYLDRAKHGQALEHYKLTRVLFEEILAQRTDVQHGAIDRIAAEESFLTAMKQRNRESLRENAEPFYDHLQAEFGISHFYIHTPANQVFLRLHKPEQFGEHINRYLLHQAAGFNLQRSVSGIEIGTHGTLTLRTLSSWRVDGRLIGYIEIGEEVEQIARRVQALAGVELVATVQKKFLSKDAWEEGMRMLGREARWDQFRDRVTISRDSSEIARRLYLGLIREKSRDMTIQADGKTFLGKLMPIRNAVDMQVGDFLVVVDVTEETTTLHRAMTLIIGFCLILGACWSWVIVTRKR